MFVVFPSFSGSSVSVRLVAAAYGEVEGFDEDGGDGHDDDDVADEVAEEEGKNCGLGERQQPAQVVMTRAQIHAPPGKKEQPTS